MDRPAFTLTGNSTELMVGPEHIGAETMSDEKKTLQVTTGQNPGG